MALPEITPQALMLDESFQHWVNRSDPEQVAYWESWLVQHPEHRETVLQAAQLVRILQSAQKPAISDQQVERTRQAVAERMKDASRTRVDRKPLLLSRLPRIWRRVAAMTMVLLVGVSGYWGYQTYLNSNISYVTGSEEIQKVRLPDGSTVTMNANSTLHFSKDWVSHSIREVWLEGEGYFEVTHFEKPTRKFLVHANEVTVEVLGTTFNVWQRKNQTKVVLQTGKVQVASNAKTWQMKPGEIIEIRDNAAQMLKRQVDPQVYTSWKENKLVIDGIAMREVASLIESRYGYRVQFVDPALANEKFTYKPLTADFEVLLHVLQESFRVEVDKEKQLIRISNSE